MKFQGFLSNAFTGGSASKASAAQSPAPSLFHFFLLGTYSQDIHILVIYLIICPPPLVWRWCSSLFTGVFPQPGTQQTQIFVE